MQLRWRGRRLETHTHTHTHRNARPNGGYRLDLEEGAAAIEDEEVREALREVISNSKLSEHFLALARDLDVMEAKVPEDVYKTHLVRACVYCVRVCVCVCVCTLVCLHARVFVRACVGGCVDFKLSGHFLALARDLDVMEAKVPEDVYKMHLVRACVCCVCTCVYVCTCVFARSCVCMCVYVFAHLCVCVRLCVCVSLQGCVCACVGSGVDLS